jgi:predicted anti-sigma-YlaC factor YlaD
MVSQACAGWRGDIGAYIVGALDHDAAARVRRHLRRCRACRADYTDLVPVRDWLDRFSPDDGMPAPQGTHRFPPLEPVRPLRRRWGWWLASGAAAACLAAAVTVQVTAQPAGPTFSGYDRATGVHGQAHLHATATGTQIDLSVSGLPAGERCTLIAVSADGAGVAGSWNAAYDGSAHITGISSLPASRVTGLLVESPAHRLLLSIHV